jgi:glycerol kinase
MARPIRLFVPHSLTECAHVRNEARYLMINNGPLTLVIDQGTHATRALVFDADGRIQTAAYAPVALQRYGADRVEQDGQEMIASAHQVIHAALADPALRRGIARAGVATQRSSVVAWDRETGAALSPVLSWQDRRAADWLSRFSAHAPEVKRRTGLPLSPHYGASKLRWLLDHDPAVQAAQRRGALAFGPLASFLLFHLLAERPLLADHANAARTLLWNMETRDWDPWLLELFGVPPAALPACRPICAPYGRLQAADVPVTAVNGDQNAAVFALGRPSSSRAVVNVGTGAFILLPTGGAPAAHPSLLCGLIHSDAAGGVYTIEGTVNGAGAALDWAAQTWRLPRPERNLPRWLARAAAPPIFLNTIGGLGSPFWRPGPPPALLGEGDAGQQAVAVVESILFLLYANLETMAAMGLPVRELQISGGLARLDGLCRRLADLSGLPVYRPAETEATARGAAFLAAGLPRRWPRPGRGRVFRPRPDPALAARYREFRARIAAEG